MGDSPFTKRLTRIGQKRLEEYIRKILEFVEGLESETQDPFIPLLTDLALTHALIMHLGRRFGPVRGLHESRVAFENTFEKLKPVMEQLQQSEKKTGGNVQ
jgi:hypothetical protein